MSAAHDKLGHLFDALLNLDFDYLTSQWELFTQKCEEVKNMRLAVDVSNKDPTSGYLLLVKYSSMAVQALIYSADFSLELRGIKALIILLLLVHKPLSQALYNSIQEHMPKNEDEIKSILMTLVLTSPLIPVSLSHSILGLVSTVRQALLLLHFVVYSQSSTQMVLPKICLLLLTDFFSNFTIRVEGAGSNTTVGICSKMLQSCFMVCCCLLAKTMSKGPKTSPPKF